MFLTVEKWDLLKSYSSAQLYVEKSCPVEDAAEVIWVPVRLQCHGDDVGVGLVSLLFLHPDSVCCVSLSAMMTQ